MTFFAGSAEETILLGEAIGARLKGGEVIALQGELGAGKTTLAKGIAKSLGVEEDVTSPTFCIVSEYEGRLSLYHFDVYRLQGADDFANLGADDMIYSDGVCLIEWSEKIMDELPKNTIVVAISVEENEERARRISIENWQYGELDFKSGGV